MGWASRANVRTRYTEADWLVIRAEESAREAREKAFREANEAKAKTTWQRFVEWLKALAYRLGY